MPATTCATPATSIETRSPSATGNFASPVMLHGPAGQLPGGAVSRPPNPVTQSAYSATWRRSGTLGDGLREGFPRSNDQGRCAGWRSHSWYVCGIGCRGATAYRHLAGPDRFRGGCRVASEAGPSLLLGVRRETRIASPVQPSPDRPQPPPPLGRRI